MTPRLCSGLFKEIAMLGSGMEVTVVASYVEVRKHISCAAQQQQQQ